MKRIRLILVATSLCIGFAAAGQTQATSERPQWEGLAGVDIIPCPKRIRLTGQKLLLAEGGQARATIVVADDADPRTRIGAAEINGSVRSLAGVELAVQTLSEFRAHPAAATAIAIDVPALSGFSTSLKRAQGYEIKAALPNILGISGVDSQGALYGCVTVSSLIARDGERVHVRTAEVADWPDFHNRASDGLSLVCHMFGLGRYSFDEAIRRGKEGLDWALRRKFNCVQARLPKGACAPGGSKIEVMTKLHKQLCEYANARGIRVIFLTHARVGTVKAHAADPRFAGIPRFHDYFFCWSRDALIEESARGVTEFVRAVGPQIFFFHFPDIHENNWAERCDRCKERFGDDRARADANVINIIARALRAGHPRATGLFVMQPYLMNFDLPQNEQWRTYYSRLSGMIPEDVYLCERECSAAEARSWRRVLRQPIFYYHEPQAFIPRKPFSAATRFAKTFYFDDQRDIYFSPVPWTSLPIFRVQDLVTSEYAWNTHAPGSDYINHDPSGVVWSGRKGDYCRERRSVGHMSYEEWLWREGGSGPPEVGKQLLERACRIAYGPTAAAAMAAGHRSGITTERENWGGPASLDLKARAEIAARHFEGARAACAALDPLFGTRETFPDLTRAEYQRLLKLNHVYKVIADVQRHLLRGQWLMTLGDAASRSQAAGEAAAGRRAIEAGRAELTEAFGRFSLHKVPDNYRLRCGGLKEALAAIDGFSGAFDLIESQLQAGKATAQTPDLLVACNFDAGKVQADFARSVGGPLAATASGVKIVPSGKVGKGVLCPDSAQLRLPAKGNLVAARGTVEMWVKPNWHWNDNERHVFFTARAADGAWRTNRMTLMKNVNYSLNFSVAGSDGKGCAVAIRPNVFRKGEWIHLAASWDCRHGVKLFVDGAVVAEAKGRWEMGELANMWLGSQAGGDRAADAALDEVRILSTARGLEANP